MKKIILILMLVSPLPLLAGWISTIPLVSDSMITLRVTGLSTNAYDGVYTNAETSPGNWDAETFYGPNWTLNWNITDYWMVASNTDIYYLQHAGYADPKLNTGYFTNFSDGEILYVQGQYLEKVSTVLTNFWPTNGGALSVAAEGITGSNNVIVVTLNSDVIFRSSPTVTEGELFSIRGRVSLDASNRLSAAFDSSLGDATFTDLTNFAGTNMQFTVGVDSEADTNLTLTAVYVTGQQGVDGVKPTFNWPPPNVPSVAVTNAVTGAPGSSVLVTNLGTSVAAVLQFTIPAGADGAPGTNTVTAYNFTNTWLGSRRMLIYQTNYATWGTTNYLGWFTNGVYDWRFQPGNDGGNPPMSLSNYLYASFTGTNAWFKMTNGFRTTNAISISVSGVGGGVTGIGGVSFYQVDHPELLNRTNYGFGQRYQFDEPVESADAATKAYVDMMVANALDGRFTSFTTNGTYHWIYSRDGVTLLDIASARSWIAIASAQVGTNVVITTPTTNLVSGWSLESSTNLLLVNGFTAYTNYVLTTNTGIATFTLPIITSEEMRFYRIMGGGTNTVTFSVPVSIPFTISPSNSWATAWSDATNRLAVAGPGSWAFGVNSNGASIWKVWNSNGVFYAQP